MGNTPLKSWKRNGIISTVLLLVFQLVNGERTNYLAYTSSEQQNQVEIFKEYVADIVTADWMKEPDFLVRYLRAKNWKTPLAKEMLADMLKWRTEQSMDTIHGEDFSEFTNKPVFAPIYLGGTSKSGLPVLRIYIKDIDLSKYIDRLEKVRRFIYKTADAMQMELYNTRSENGSREITAYTCIYNMKGYEAPKHICLGAVGLTLPLTTCMSFWTSMVVITENYFLEMCDEIIWVNVPPALAELATTTTGLMSDRNRARLVQIKEAAPLTELRKYVDVENLPFELQGEKSKDELKPKRIKKQPWDKAFYGRK